MHCSQHRVRLLMGLLALSALTACSTAGFHRAAPVHHFVICWLKDPGNAEQRQQLISASYELASIPGVVSVAAGTAIASDRPVVDGSYDVAILFTFSSSEDLAAYLEHPDHLRATREVLKPLVDRVVIYDFVAAKP